MLDFLNFWSKPKPPRNYVVIQDNYGDIISIIDMRAKGRQARGEKNGRSKLSTEDVRTIRQLCFDGARQYDVSQQFGIDQSMVSLIAQRRKWAHV